MQDNVKNIYAHPIKCTSIKGIQDKYNNNIMINGVLAPVETPDEIGNNQYMCIVYNANVMSPKIRNGLNTFFYNDEEYLAEKYNQYADKFPIYANESASMNLRSDELVNAMDIWNFEYLNNESKRTQAPVFSGQMNQYGNGYEALDYSADEGQYAEDDTLSLKDTVKANDKYIYNEQSVEDITHKPSSDI